MTSTHIPSRISRPLALGAVLTAALFAAACGDSSGESPSNADTAAKAEVQAAVTRFYDALKGGDATEVCALLAADGREDIVASIGDVRAGDTCPQAFQRFMRNAKRTGNLSPQLTVEIKSIKVTGNRALAKVVVGDSPLTELPLIHHNGQWRVASTTPAG